METLNKNIQNKNYDVVIVGGGVAGCCLARELSKYKAKILVLEAGLDVAPLTSRANSGIVHAGYDPKPGSLKAKYNVWGSKVYPKWASELGFQYKRNGAFVVAFDKHDMDTVHMLYERGIENGVENLEILNKDQALKLEPNLNPNIEGALYIPTSGICDPYQVAYRSAENAINNGAKVKLKTKVTTIKINKSQNYNFNITCENGEEYNAKCIVNAAGVYADEINNMVSSDKIKINPKRGEYCLFDTTYGDYFTNTIFQCPTKAGKGILVAPTVHGNLFIGPTSEPIKNKDDLSTTVKGLKYTQQQARKSWPDLDMRGLITNFSGVRACGDTGDFIIGEAKDVQNFWNIAGFESPGLTSAPAVAEDISKKIADKLNLSENKNFNSCNKIVKRFYDMNSQEREELIKQNPDFGHIICRCHKVTEGEIKLALENPVPMASLDAIKWRTGATMGRCHGGFCTPEIVKYICKKYSIKPEDIDKRMYDSWMFDHAKSDYLNLVEPSFKSENITISSINSIDDQVDKCDKHANSTNKIIAENKDKTNFDLCIVGAGACGLAATISAIETGCTSICLIDRESKIGGILKQCIHSGFGLEHFKEELTGPEYVHREVLKLYNLLVQNNNVNLEILNGALATKLSKTDNIFSVEVAHKTGYRTIKSKAVILSSGSRERGFGTLNIAGDRPSGIYTAGTAQAFINLQGVVPGKNAVVLGSGDIGLIMTRRMILSGMNVKAVYELMPNPSGLRRNIVQCLEDYDIPLYLSHTVTKTHGSGRLEAVTIQEVDENLNPIDGTEEIVGCDTLVLSVGLIPECELALECGADFNPATKSVKVGADFQTKVDGLFVCGNALHIHDLVDYVSKEGSASGINAAKFIKGDEDLQKFEIKNNHKQEIEESNEANVEMLTCTVCPNGCTLKVTLNSAGKVEDVTGNKCPNGYKYAKSEFSCPTRNISALMNSKSCLEPISVKTSSPIPKDKIKDVANEILDSPNIDSAKVGDVLIKDVCGTNSDIVATKNS